MYKQFLVNQGESEEFQAAYRHLNVNSSTNDGTKFFYVMVIVVFAIFVMKSQSPKTYTEFIENR